MLGNWAGAKGSTSGGYNVIIGGNALVGTQSEAVNQSIAIGAGGGENRSNIINGAWAKGDQSIAIGEILVQMVTLQLQLVEMILIVRVVKIIRVQINLLIMIRMEIKRVNIL